MARKQKDENGETAPTEIDSFDLPAGFNPVGFSGPRVWWKPEVGSTIRGIVVGLEKRSTGKGEFLVIKATATCHGMRNVAPEGADAEYENVDVEIGQLICVDLRADFEAFRDYAESGDTWEIIARAKAKKRLANGNTFWQFDKGSRLVAKARVAKSDDIPF